jgi:uncharacterized membrane protein YeiH
MAGFHLLQLWDLFGVTVFALSGALRGAQKGLDLWGMFFLATLTAMGGGTLRSLLIGDLPPPVFREPFYLTVIVVTTGAAFVLAECLYRLRWAMLISDALGLGLFTSVGIAVSMAHGLEAWAALAMGVVTACFGGIMRDIAVNEVPLILQGEIYATACLGGGGVYLALHHLGADLLASTVAATLCIVSARILAVRYNLSLPRLGTASRRHPE